MERFKNLQMFADVQVTTQDSLSPEMKTYYDMTLIDYAQANLVHGQFGQKKPIPANGGKSIEFRKFAPLAKATTPLVEGVTPAGKSLEVNNIIAEVEQYGDFIVMSDMLDLTAIDPVIVEATKLLGRQAGLTLDTIVRDILQAETTVFYCPKKAADGTETEVLSRSALDKTCVLTVDVVMQVAAELKAQNAPAINGDYVAIIHPYAVYDLMRDPEWQNAHNYATPENIYEGEIGKIAGVRFVETSEAKIYSGSEDQCPTNLGVFGTLFFGDNAYGDTEVTGGGLETIVKPKGSSGTADPLNQRSSVGWKSTKTAKVLIPQYMMRVESCSPRFSPGLEAN